MKRLDEIDHVDVIALIEHGLQPVGDAARRNGVRGFEHCYGLTQGCARVAVAFGGVK